LPTRSGSRAWSVAALRLAAAFGDCLRRGIRDIREQGGAHRFPKDQPAPVGLALPDDDAAHEGEIGIVGIIFHGRKIALHAAGILVKRNAGEAPAAEGARLTAKVPRRFGPGVARPARLPLGCEHCPGLVESTLLLRRQEAAGS